MSDNEATANFPSTEHHLWLKKNMGDWDVDCSYFLGPDSEAIEVRAVDVSDMLGDYWWISRFKADMLGTILDGHASTGYDPVRKCYISTWKDSSHPFHYYFTGNLDNEGVLKLEGENFDPVRQVRANYRFRIEFLSDDEKVHNLSVQVDDAFAPILEYRFKRAVL